VGATAGLQHRASMCVWEHATRAGSVQKSIVGESMLCHLCTAGCGSARDAANIRIPHGRMGTAHRACRIPELQKWQEK
jgi:hypothetical protein